MFCSSCRSKNGLLDLSLGVGVAEGAAVGAPDFLEVLDPAVEVGVLLEVGADGNSGTVGELGPGVAHGAGEQEISPGGRKVESSKSHSRHKIVLLILSLSLSVCVTLILLPLDAVTCAITSRKTKGLLNCRLLSSNGKLSKF